MKFIFSIAFLVLFSAAAGPASGQAVLHVDSRTHDAFVMADATVLGTVHESPFELAPGTYVVQLLPGNSREWEQTTPRAEVTLENGATQTVRLDFDFRIRLESVPFGADVHEIRSDRPLGRTPVSIFLAEGDSVGVSLTREGFRPATAWLHATEPFRRESIQLLPDNATGAGEHAISWEPPGRSNQWIDYGAAGLALVAGIAAVHFKFRADSLFDEYEKTGDPDLRPKFNRYDIYSGVALGAMQVGVGVLGVRILLR